MTTATTLAAVPDTGPSSAGDIPRCSYRLAVHTRHRGRFTDTEMSFTALAMLDGGSMLNLVGGGTAEQATALRTMLVRVTVDDDGVGNDVEPRVLREDQVSYGWLDGDTDDDEDDDEAVDEGPPPIPGDAALGRLKKSELVALAEAHSLSTDGTNADLIAGLAAARDYLAEQSTAGTDLARGDEPVDADLDDDPPKVRLVWPREKGADPDDPWDLAVEDEFASIDDAVVYAADHGSSLRRFRILITDPMSFVPPESLNTAIGDISEAATGRPTGPSAGSRRSPRRRGRRGRT